MNIKSMDTLMRAELQRIIAGIEDGQRIIHSIIFSSEQMTFRLYQIKKSSFNAN